MMLDQLPIHFSRCIIQQGRHAFMHRREERREFDPKASDEEVVERLAVFYWDYRVLGHDLQPLQLRLLAPLSMESDFHLLKFVH